MLTPHNKVGKNGKQEAFKHLCAASLLEVIATGANEFQALYDLLRRLEKLLDPNERHADHITTETVHDLIDIVAGDARAHSQKLTLQRTRDRLRRLPQCLARKDASAPFWADVELQTEMRVLYEAISDDLDERVIFFPNPEKAKRWNQPALFGQAVFDRFEDARQDVKAAGSCYATDNDTACVLHLMRVAEYGLRALAKRVRGIRFGRDQRIEYTDWGEMIKKLRGKIDELQKKSKGRKRAEQLDFYSDALDRCVFFKNHWRDRGAHARAGYSEPEALNALTQVEQFMRLLATR